MSKDPDQYIATVSEGLDDLIQNAIEHNTKVAIQVTLTISPDSPHLTLETDGEKQ